MTSGQEFDADVIVVGGGPVGSVTALKLARGGQQVIVLEGRDAMTLEQRATTFHPPTLEMLDDLGLADPLIERGIIARSYQFRDAKLGKIVDLDYGVLSGDTRFPFRLQVEQSVMTSMAIDKLHAHELADYRTSAQVGRIRAGDEAVEVDVTSATGTETLRARHLVAADGMKSTVREQLNIEFSGHTYPERYLVIATGTPLQNLLPDIAYVNYVADPVDWHVIMANPTGWRILFPAPASAGTDAEVLDQENVRRNYARVIPAFEDEAIQRVTLYEVHRKVAAQLRVGNMYLVGDAAHVNNPLGGMGMNSGVHDGFTLAEVLLAGADGDELDSWAAKRKAVALNFVGKETEGNWSALRDTDEDRRAVQRETWRNLGEDAEARRTFLLNSSMLASLR